MKDTNKKAHGNLRHFEIHRGLCHDKNALKRRRECGTYLATARRHHRRLKMMKKD